MVLVWLDGWLSVPHTPPAIIYHKRTLNTSGLTLRVK
ncbi:hypothetical protein MP228_006126 [Amoeboaphelidium protococcarum]|nr:hypothetical protein MP228_006126 [Amoeboaphelidium protococcarum]